MLFFTAKVLGPHLGQDFVFFEQACNFCQTCGNVNEDMETELLSQLILPALSLCEKSEQAASLVWNILSKLDSQTRYQLYTRWLRGACNSSRVLKAIASLLEEDLSVLMPQLTLETMGTVGKSIGTLVTGCPLVAWNQILLHVLWTEDRVPVLVQLVISHCDPFAQDTLMFIIYEILADEDRLPFKEDGISLQPWFQSLSMLIGCLFARSRYLQDSCLLTYVSFLQEQLSTRAASLYLFLDLLTAMSGIKPLMKLSETEFAALGGSALLKRQVLFSERRNNSIVGQNLPETFDFPHTFPSSIKFLFSTLHHNFLGAKILEILSRSRLFLESPVLCLTHFRGISFLVFLQLLFVMNLADVDADVCGINSDLAMLCDKDTLRSRSLRFALKRKFLRPKIDSRCLDCVNDFLPKTSGSEVDPRFIAFLWALDAYDVYVPEAEYVRETTRIEGMYERSQCQVEVEDARVHLVDSLKTSYAIHRAHVVWLLPHLPKVDVSEPLIKVALTRASKSPPDAHFVFLFLARTLDDPTPLFRYIFDRKVLVSLLFSEDYEILGVIQFLVELWRDLRSWPSQEASGELHGMQTMSGPRDMVNRCVLTTTEGNRDSYATCTLFRQGMETEDLLQQWEEETVSAISAALNNFTTLAVNYALQALICLAEFLPHRQDLRYSLIERQLPVLARDAKDCDVAALARKAIEIFSNQKVDVDVCADTENKEDDVLSNAAKRRKQDPEEMGTKLIEDQGSSIKRRRSLRILKRIVSSKRRL